MHAQQDVMRFMHIKHCFCCSRQLQALVFGYIRAHRGHDMLNVQKKVDITRRGASRIIPGMNRVLL